MKLRKSLSRVGRHITSPWFIEGLKVALATIALIHAVEKWRKTNAEEKKQ